MDEYTNVALVTGGAQGIGKAIVLDLLQQRYAVTFLDQYAKAGQATLAEYTRYGPLQFVETDVADEQAVQAAIQTCHQTWGRLDALINNAGIANPTNAPIEKLDLKDWQQVLDVNLTGYFLLAKHCVPLLREHNGAIVNIASTRAIQSEAHTEAYAASKGGVVALTHALAISLGPNIRVNSISPGWISVTDWQKSSERTQPELTERDHQQHPAGRVGQPQDIATFVRYLISPEAAFITAQNFIIDGGMTRKMIYEE